MSYPDLARRALEYYFSNNGKYMSPEKPDSPDYSGPSKGVFVCLKKGGELRGCIGTIEPVRGSLGEEIAANAVSAAVQDPRFPPVESAELGELHITVDVLDEPEDACAGELDPAEYGVIVSTERYPFRRGLLLPALEGVDTVEAQLSIALRKAGIRPEESYRIQRFRVRRYEEE
ncbi:MAG: AmmeMemoRadiSam system protein A [Spirochaetaceae bacterium]|jgi:AmmeMemoRadiSam system protein A|nr:AmmeMemoRadiSam system protein A [Spirochaetaceae bacterium]